MKDEVGWTVSLHRQSWSCCDLEEEERKRQQEGLTVFQRSGFRLGDSYLEGIECMYSCRRMPPPPPPHEHTHMHNTQGIDKGKERDWKRK